MSSVDCPKPIVIARALLFYLGYELRRSQVRDYLYVLRSGYPECDMDFLTNLVIEELESLGAKVLNDYRNEIAKFDDGYSVSFDGEKVVITFKGETVKETDNLRVKERIYELVKIAKDGKELLNLVDSLENYEKEVEELKRIIRNRVY